MKHVIVSVVCLLGGCLVVPKSVVTDRHTGVETSFHRSAPVSTSITAKQAGDAVVVRMTRRHTCERRKTEVTEVTRRRKLKFASTDPRSVAIGVWLAPLTIPVSALVSALVVGASRPHTTRTTRPLGGKSFPCIAAAAAEPYQVTLPSGRVVTRQTDAAGDGAVVIPLTEPYRGTLAIAAAGTTRTVDYAFPVPAVTALRDAARACAAKFAITDPIGIDVDVDDRGRATAIGGGTDELASCTLAALDGVAFPTELRAARVELRLAAR